MLRRIVEEIGPKVFQTGGGVARPNKRDDIEPEKDKDRECQPVTAKTAGAKLEPAAKKPEDQNRS